MGLNELVGLLLDLIQNTRDDWDAESSIQQADLNPSAKDTSILLDAITKGSGTFFIKNCISQSFKPKTHV